jgi:hypothetical protein
MTTGPYSQDLRSKLEHIYLFMTLFQHSLRDRNSTAFPAFTLCLKNFFERVSRFLKDSLNNRYRSALIRHELLPLLTRKADEII